MTRHFDIAVVGAGPAGIAAATVAAQHGADVALIDEQPRTGGQIYRSLSAQSLADPSILGADYYAGQTLLDALAGSDVEHLSDSTVWQVTPGQVGLSRAGAAQLMHADQIILATGAMERPFPVPGWSLPGVMMAGAAQILLKTSALAAPGAVFIGTGPLLYLIVTQYLRAGIPVQAVLDTTPPGNGLRALRHLPGALAHAGDLAKGLGWLRGIRRAGVPFITRVQDVRLLGDCALSAVEYRRAATWTRIETERAFLHQGVVPNPNLAMAAGCAHRWNHAQLCWQAQTGDWGESTKPGISIGGDGAGIGGARAAGHSGRLAALGALHALGLIGTAKRDRLAAPHRKAYRAEMRLRRFLDAYYRPADRFRVPQDQDTIVCRCEEVSAGQIRAATDLGCLGPNQLKTFTRAGMGPCQGRFCGLTVAEIIAQSRGVPVAEVGALRLRSPVKPLSLGELAKLQVAPGDADATEQL